MVNEIKHQDARLFADYLSTFSFVEEVFLIGSQVTGNVHSKSDIDICILCDGFDFVDYNFEWTLKKSEFNPDIQIVPLSKEIVDNMKFYDKNKDSSIILFKRR
ncbi:hypothetical protein PMSD_04980 [Paenibacillus macquariensis subsp. defensor]|nr:hypothetical protein PMSD_04980 [Paenibacillus macquariensis subsp. defensor]